VDGIVTPPPCGGGGACKASSLFTSSSFGTAARDRFRGSDGPPPTSCKSSFSLALLVDIMRDDLKVKAIKKQ
jgi:hypothetical protein